ncbi:MAG: AGE family epimerase/isomerase [Verrucomicrobiota bacterium]|nr:AGE family epimerase/isomerase [Verrucomicrobiota bacterium]
MNYIHLLLGLLFFFAGTNAFCASAPAKEKLREQAELCKRILQESLINFYYPACLDKEQGGYFEVLDSNGKFSRNGERFLTLQARQTWFFSTLAALGYEREQMIAAAKHGFDFLQGKMLDREHGGYFSKVTDSGEIKDPRKHVYLNAFTLYAISAYCKATEDETALEAAKALFTILEEKAYDQKHGGYLEFFYRDWREISAKNENGYVGAIGHKTYNTHLHVMEALAELYRVWPDARVSRRLGEMVLINMSTVRYPGVDANVDAFERDWTIVQTLGNLRASYGHDIECVWLVKDAAATLNLQQDTLRNWADALGQNCLRYGYDREHGGFYAGGPLGKPADRLEKTWWIQTEALPGTLALWESTGKLEYYEAFSKTLEFCARHQVAKEGGWWATRNRDGSAHQDKARTSSWQGAYHSGRAMITCAKWLEELARRPSLPGIK